VFPAFYSLGRTHTDSDIVPLRETLSVSGTRPVRHPIAPRQPPHHSVAGALLTELGERWVMGRNHALVLPVEDPRSKEGR